MASLVSLKRTKKDRERDKPQVATEASYPDDEGVAVHLDHDHLMKLKGADGEPIAGRMKNGHKVEFRGSGSVERAESRSSPEGDRYSATIRLHKGSLEHEPGEDEERGELKNEIEKNYAAGEKK